MPTDSIVTDPISKPTNPLLGRIQLPGETFKLPSCGVFYTNNELSEDVKDAEVHVRPMTVLDEIVMKSPDMLYSGRAVHEVFARCIPQVLKPERLLAKDIDFLMLCLRKVSYGDTLELEVVHANCPAFHGKTKEFVDKQTGEKTTRDISPIERTYDVDVMTFIRGTKRLDPTSIVKTFSVKLSNGQIVKMQPIRYDDFIKLMQMADVNSETTPEQELAALIDSIANVIISVDEVTDGEFIKEWLREVKPEYLRALEKQLGDSVHWGPDFKYKVECKDCGEHIEMIAPLNPLAFFT